MKLSNFQLLEVERTGFTGVVLRASALVDVTEESGALWWKKSQTVRRPIARELAGMWFFQDTGKFTPAFQAEQLARAWAAQHKTSLV